MVVEAVIFSEAKVTDILETSLDPTSRVRSENSIVVPYRVHWIKNVVGMTLR